MNHTIKPFLLLALAALGLPACDGEPGEPSTSTSETTTEASSTSSATTGSESTGGESSTGEVLIPAGECGFCPSGLECIRVDTPDFGGHTCSRKCWGVGTCDDLGLVCKAGLVEGDPSSWCVDTCTFHEQCRPDELCTGNGYGLGVCINP